MEREILIAQLLNMETVSQGAVKFTFLLTIEMVLAFRIYQTN